MTLCHCDFVSLNNNNNNNNDDDDDDDDNKITKSFLCSSFLCSPHVITCVINLSVRNSTGVKRCCIT